MPLQRAAPVSTLTAEREKLPVVVYALNIAPTRLAKPRPMISWLLFSSTYRPRYASVRAMDMLSDSDTKHVAAASGSIWRSKGMGNHKRRVEGGRPAQQQALCAALSAKATRWEQHLAQHGLYNQALCRAGARAVSQAVC